MGGLGASSHGLLREEAEREKEQDAMEVIKRSERWAS